mmetsp:Transcript_5021/g.12992  ORF Transcript_5021/g.12992 Transcript_5021/m.12992 type:complete len:251 (+) Transcript_5021:1360-2112(+)
MFSIGWALEGFIPRCAASRAGTKSTRGQRSHNLISRWKQNYVRRTSHRHCENKTHCAERRSHEGMASRNSPNARKGPRGSPGSRRAYGKINGPQKLPRASAALLPFLGSPPVRTGEKTDGCSSASRAASTASTSVCTDATSKCSPGSASRLKRHPFGHSIVDLHPGSTVPFGYCGPIQHAVPTNTWLGGDGGGGVYGRTCADAHEAFGSVGPGAERKKHLFMKVLTFHAMHAAFFRHAAQHVGMSSPSSV